MLGDAKLELGRVKRPSLMAAQRGPRGAKIIGKSMEISCQASVIGDFNYHDLFWRLIYTSDARQAEQANRKGDDGELQGSRYVWPWE